jgi:CelD/BcsL family acetyltransferase involved in cellulose biosynthesis
VKELNEFESLESDWNSLLKNSTIDNNVFLTWEWLSTWWKHFGNGRELLILTVEEENKVLAIAPLMLSKYKLRRFGNVSKVEFLGVPHSDYNNFIILEREKDCLRNIINYLNYDVSEWDWIELGEVVESTSTAKLLQEIFLDSSIKLRKKEHVCNICPYTSLPGSFDIFMKELNGKLRKSLNRNLRKLVKDFSVEFKDYKSFNFSADEAMELFFKLHDMRWKERSVLEGTVLKDFHLRVAKCFAENGWLSLHFLTLNDEPVSAHYGFNYGQKLYGYLTGFDPEYSSYSVGNISERFLVEECIKRGLRELDLLRGNEAYKNRWTNTYRRNFEIRLAHKTPFNLLYEIIERALASASLKKNK